jgi:hypothetical protein
MTDVFILTAPAILLNTSEVSNPQKPKQIRRFAHKSPYGTAPANRIGEASCQIASVKAGNFKS